jgi:hypothetical protein
MISFLLQFLLAKILGSQRYQQHLFVGGQRKQHLLLAKDIA